MMGVTWISMRTNRIKEGQTKVRRILIELGAWLRVKQSHEDVAGANISVHDR